MIKAILKLELACFFAFGIATGHFMNSYYSQKEMIGRLLIMSVSQLALENIRS